MIYIVFSIFILIIVGLWSSFEHLRDDYRKLQKINRDLSSYKSRNAIIDDKSLQIIIHFINNENETNYTIKDIDEVHIFQYNNQGNISVKINTGNDEIISYRLLQTLSFK